MGEPNSSEVNQKPVTWQSPTNIAAVIRHLPTRLHPKFTSVEVDKLKSIADSGEKTGWLHAKENVPEISQDAISSLSSIHGLKKAQHYIANLQKQPQVKSKRILLQSSSSSSSSSSSLLKITIPSYHKSDDYQCLMSFDNASKLVGSICKCGTGSVIMMIVCLFFSCSVVVCFFNFFIFL